MKETWSQGAKHAKNEEHRSRQRDDFPGEMNVAGAHANTEGAEHKDVEPWYRATSRHEGMTGWIPSGVMLVRALMVATTVFFATSASCQRAGSMPAAQRLSSVTQPSYLAGSPKIHLENLIPSPPSLNSARAREDLAEVHRIEQSRTPAEVQAAQYDDTHEDIFIYADVLGERFRAQALPLTFELSKRLRREAGIVDNPLKQLYGRPRPYNLDHTLHPVCETNKELSYPSGHSTNGYLFAFALAEIVPEKHDEILRLADQYAHNRVICGSHYPSDTEASRRVATFLFGYLLANSQFRADLSHARRETRTALKLSTLGE